MRCKCFANVCFPGLAEEQIKVYLDEFEQRVEQEILMIGNISLDDVQVSLIRLIQRRLNIELVIRIFIDCKLAF